jgi:flavin-binding protein dodecin
VRVERRSTLSALSRDQYQGDPMSSHVYKLIELVGTSPTSTDDAIRNAIQKAAVTVKHIDWYQVVESRGHVQDGRIAHFQVSLKVGFRIEDE